MKNLACSRLETMLYLEIQKGKEATKTEKFQQQIGGTSECMDIITMDKKGVAN